MKTFLSAILVAATLGVAEIEEKPQPEPTPLTPGEQIIIHNQQVLDAKLSAVIQLQIEIYRRLPRDPLYRSPTDRITI